MSGNMKGCAKHGFTLVELLLTMGISAILLVTLAILAAQSARSFAMARRNTDQMSGARALIHLLEHELSTRLPGSPLMCSGGKPDRIAWIRLVSPHEEKAGDPGDLATYFYYLHQVEEANGSISQKLFRKCIGPAGTQRILEGDDPSLRPEPEPETDEIVLEQVLGFSMTPVYFDPSTQKLETWDESSPVPAERLKMRLKLIDEAATKGFSNGEDWSRAADSPNPDELPHIRTFSHTFDLTEW